MVDISFKSGGESYHFRRLDQRLIDKAKLISADGKITKEEIIDLYKVADQAKKGLSKEEEAFVSNLNLNIDVIQNKDLKPDSFTFFIKPKESNSKDGIASFDVTKDNIDKIRESLKKILSERTPENKDKPLTSEEISKIEVKMGKNGSKMSKNEQLFMSLLTEGSNIKKFNESPDSNKLEFDVKQLGLLIEDSAESKPLGGTTVNDLGYLVKIDLANQFITTESLSSDIGKILALKKDPNLSPEVNDLIGKLPKNSKKEGLIYLKNMLTRDPAISNKDLKSIISELNEMMNKNYPDNINSPVLVFSCMSNIALPTNIQQGANPTCVATSAEIQFAIKNPVEYIKLVDSLFKGESYSLNGNTISPNNSWRQYQGDKNGNRNLASSMLQTVFMDIGNGDKIDYNSVKDRYNHGGLHIQETDNLMDTLFGNKNYMVCEKPDLRSSGDGETKVTGVEFDESKRATRQQVFDKIFNLKPSRSNPVLVGISYAKEGEHSSHAVNIIGIDNTSKRVTVINPWGREETIPLGTFKKNVIGVVF